jgi:hypothetical protein
MVDYIMHCFFDVSPALSRADKNSKAKQDKADRLTGKEGELV